jgi:hypothetical protein
MAEGCTVESGTMFKRFRGRNGVYAAQGASHDQQVVEIIELRGVASLPWIECKPEVAKVAQTFSSIVQEWSDDRQFVFYQLEAELVFFKDLLVTPSLWPIKLGNQWFSIFDANLVNPVFIAVEGKGAAVAKKATALNSIHDETGRQGFEVVLGLWLCHYVRITAGGLNQDFTNVMGQ